MPPGPTAAAPTLAGVLTIARAHVDAIIAHALRDHPDEACGVITGPAGSDEPVTFVEMLNADRSPTFFRFDPQEQLRLYRELDDRDEDIVVIYHSHTSTEAYPSRTDISYAAEPHAHYVVVSTAESGREDGPVSVRSFRIVDASVTEEELEVQE